MSTTAKWVFDKAIYLMDEQNESSGQTQTEDTREYEFRALGIMNILRHELYPFSATYNRESTGRPICPEITSFDDTIDLDDAVAQGVMPYGLAAHLLLGENDTMANYFSQRYMEALLTMRMTNTTEIESIPLYYGGLDC